MKRPQLQSLKAFVAGLTAGIIALLPVVKMLGYLFFAVFVFYLGVGVVLELTGYLLQPFGLPFITELISTSILDPFIEFIRQLPTIEGVTSEPSAPDTQDPSAWGEAEGSVWEPVFEMIETMGLMLVFWGIWAAFLLHSIGDSTEDTRRAEPMTIEELEEHYESQYENGEITQEEHDERIEMVYEIKGLEDDDQ